MRVLEGTDARTPPAAERKVCSATAGCGSMRWATFSRRWCFRRRRGRARSADSGERRGHAELVDFEDLGLRLDVAILDVEAADDDEVRVEGLREATDGGGAAGAEAGGKAEMLEGVLAVVAADGEEAYGVEALAEGVGEGVADPAEVGLAGAVVEGKDEDEMAAGLADVGGRVGLGWRLGAGSRDGDERASEQACDEEATADRAGGSSDHDVTIIEGGRVEALDWPDLGLRDVPHKGRCRGSQCFDWEWATL